MDFRRLLGSVGLAVALGLPASAADIALIVGNEEYEGLPDLDRGTLPLTGAAALESAGVTVLTGRDATAERLQRLSAEFVQMAPASDGVVVALSGRFLTTGHDTYFLPVDGGDAGLLEVPRVALPLSVVMAVLDRAEGPALLALATEDVRGAADDPYLSPGLGPIAPPEAVTVVTGDPRAVARLLERLDDDDISVAGLVDRRDGLTAVGEPSTRAPFLTADDGRSAEATLWDVAQDLDTVDAYELYLDRYPRGRYAQEARAAIDFIEGAPERRAQETEEALNLTRDERRQIQRDLVLLGYNTRGIDGIFGPGTRGAISDWQVRNDFEGTSYLTRPQLQALASQAEVRAAELEREAEARRQEQERQDRAFWQASGADGGEAGLRRYLDRFPDGLYAEQARARLDTIEERKRQDAAAADRAAWLDAREVNTAEAYRSYLTQFPQGAFVNEAEAQLAVLRGRQARAAEDAQAREAEGQLGLNMFTRRAVEQRLQALGLEPGPVDGEFTDDTRRAVRRYQDRAGLPVSGFLNEPTVVRLLADSIRSILD
ncbi:peptidoglycan-binding domain-containing protein [Tranquillimonas alkanivorans]|uniref:Putative peptidoglycan binding domain-containing protein n=1 Tax=Tranquillimonas alkanivorans TaxID=441119 RepID=A0A1I5PU00_9RHOB|nr:peptidoglycan-binding protein [Tranquillimonas alkanivorans]SFP37041.1 Putative peptidoglycan binding domain-containing protein [Tranquillimonas alkanivorans]